MDDVQVEGGIIPKGSQIFLNVFRMNKTELFYGENAHEYYPERFLPENCADWHPYLFIPFSAGKRNCIGLYNSFFFISGHFIFKLKF